MVEHSSRLSNMKAWREYDRRHIMRLISQPIFPECERDSIDENYYNRFEQVRLSSFRGWLVDFISPSELAKNGFYYLKHRDMVKCFSCGLKLCEWDKDDSVQVEHERFSYCKINRNLEKRNVPLGANPLLYDLSFDLTDSIKSYFYRFEQVRLASFEKWTLDFIDPFALAKNGFYYIKRWGVVKCFSCNLEVWNWKEGDTIQERHNHNPNCNFHTNSERRNVPLEDNQLLYDLSNDEIDASK